LTSIGNKLQYLLETKEAIREAIIAKGIPVTVTDTFREYAEKILLITANLIDDADVKDIKIFESFFLNDNYRVFQAFKDAIILANFYFYDNEITNKVVPNDFIKIAITENTQILDLLYSRNAQFEVFFNDLLPFSETNSYFYNNVVNAIAKTLLIIHDTDEDSLQTDFNEHSRFKEFLSLREFNNAIKPPFNNKEDKATFGLQEKVEVEIIPKP
jgi:hypothetical protein